MTLPAEHKIPAEIRPARLRRAGRISAGDSVWRLCRCQLPSRWRKANGNDCFRICYMVALNEKCRKNVFCIALCFNFSKGTCS